MTRIEKLRQIIAQKQYAKVDGVIVDLFTASSIIAIYDKAGPKIRKAIEDMPIEKVASISMRLTK